MEIWSQWQWSGRRPISDDGQASKVQYTGAVSDEGRTSVTSQCRLGRIFAVCTWKIPFHGVRCSAGLQGAPGRQARSIVGTSGERAARVSTRRSGLATLSRRTRARLRPARAAVSLSARWFPHGPTSHGHANWQNWQCQKRLIRRARFGGKIWTRSFLFCVLSATIVEKTDREIGHSFPSVDEEGP